VEEAAAVEEVKEAVEEFKEKIAGAEATAIRVQHELQPLYIKFPRGLKTLHVSFSSTTVGELISEIQGLLLTDVHWQVLVQGVGAAPNALRCLLFCGKSYLPGGTGTEKLLSQINMHRECTADVYLTIMPFSEPPAAEAEAAGTNAGAAVEKAKVAAQKITKKVAAVEEAKAAAVEKAKVAAVEVAKAAAKLSVAVFSEEEVDELAAVLVISTRLAREKLECIDVHSLATYQGNILELAIAQHFSAKQR